MSLEGKITLTLCPPDYGKTQSLWSSHPDLNLISELLGTNLDAQDETETDTVDFLKDSDESEEEESDDVETNSKPVISNKFGALASCLEND